MKRIGSTADKVRSIRAKIYQKWILKPENVSMSGFSASQANSFNLDRSTITSHVKYCKEVVDFPKKDQALFDLIKMPKKLAIVDSKLYECVNYFISDCTIEVHYLNESADVAVAHVENRFFGTISELKSNHLIWLESALNDLNYRQNKPKYKKAVE